MKMAVGLDAVERLRAWQRLRARRHSLPALPDPHLTGLSRG
jgi:hypothetical protein